MDLCPHGWITETGNGLGHLDYPERLKVIDLPTLRYRRMRGDMIEVYKHCNTYDADIISPSFQKSARPSRQHNSQLIQQRRPRDGVTGLETNCFYNRTIETCNELPRNVAEADDITEFKINLDKAWSDMPWKFDHKAETESGS